jgi:hypothetical protein
VADDNLDDKNAGVNDAVKEWDQPPEPGTFDIGLDGKRWTVHRFHELDDVLPEKMELIEGKLFWGERYRLGMLAAMLVQVGLKDAVRLAPRELWLEALRQADK